MTQFDHSPEKRQSDVTPGSQHEAQATPVSPFRERLDKVFYGKPLLNGDVPNIFGIDSELLTEGPAYQQFQQRDPGKNLSDYFSEIGVKVTVDAGHPFLDDHGYPVRLIEARTGIEGEERWIITDQKYFCAGIKSNLLPEVEQVSSRTRMVQYVSLEDGMYRTYSTAQFDISRSSQVLEELLLNARRALEQNNGGSSFLLRSFKALVHRQALSKIEHVLHLELDDPYLDREKGRAAHLHLSKWQEGSPPFQALDYQGINVSLPAGRFSGQLDGIEFSVMTKLPFGEERYSRFGAALNASGFLVLFVPPSYPAV